MPIVVPKDDAPAVAPQGLPGSPQSVPRALVFGSEMGPAEQLRAGQQLETAGAQIGQMVAQQNEATVKSADAQFVQGATAVLYDPQNGYMNQRGQTAVQGSAATLENLQKQAKSISDNLPNDESRAMFQSVAAQRLNAYQEQIDEHASRQQTVWNLDASKSRAGAMQNAAVASYNPVPGADNKAYLQSMASLHNELDSQAQIAGMDPDTKKAYIQNGIASANAGVVQHLLENNQTAGARAYFNSVRADMPPGLADKLDAQIKGAKDFDETYAYTDSLAIKHPGDEAGQMKAIAADFSAGNIDGHQRALAEAQVQHNFGVQRQEQEQAAVHVLGNVSDFILKNPAAGIQDFAKAFPAQYEALKESGHLQTAIDYFKNGGMSPTGDPMLFNNLMDMSTKNPQALLEYPQDKLMAQLSRAQYNRVMAAREGIIKQSQQQMTSDKLVNDTVTSTKHQLEAAGLDTNPKDDDGKQRFGKFESELRMRLYEAIQEKGGAPLTGKEADDIALALVKKISIPGTGIVGLFETHKAPFEMSPDEKTAIGLIPDDDRETIINALQNNHIPVTEANIRELYRRKQAAK